MLKLHCMETISTLKWMLDRTGLWPKRTMTKMDYLKVVINWFVSISLMVIIFLEAIKHTYNMRVLNELACTAFPYATYMIKLRSVTLKKECFFAVLEDMNSDIFNENFSTEKLRKPIKVAIDTSHKLAKLFKSMVFMVIIFWAIFPFLDENAQPIPFSYNLGRYHHLMHIYQSVAFGLTGWNISCIDVLFCVLTIVATCQIDVLRLKLSSCVADVEADIQCGISKQEEFDYSVTNKLKACVRLHTAIISFVAKLENMFSAAVFAQYTTGMVLYCSTVFQLIYIIDPHSFQFISNVVFLSGILTQVCMYHWFGDDVIHKSNQINDSCYECHWYKCKPSFRKIMFALMERAKKPLCITTLNFTTVSLTSLLTMFKWSYSLFALLKTKYST